MKRILKGFLHMQTDSFNHGALVLYGCDMSNTKYFNCVMIKKLEIEVDIPDNFDPRPAQIQALKKKQEQAAADFHVQNTEILRQISELQALEMA